LATATATATPAAASTPLRRISKRRDLPFHKVAVVLAVSVIPAKLQRCVIRLNRVGPLFQRLLLIRFLKLLTRPVQRIPEVVVSILLVRQPLRIAGRRGLDRFLERLCCLGKLSSSIRGRPRVVFHNRRLGIGRSPGGGGLIGTHGPWLNDEQRHHNQHNDGARRRCDRYRSPPTEATRTDHQTA
jgi:hypothetical protein